MLHDLDKKEKERMENNKNFKILLADDDADIVEFISFNLRKEGYQVFTAENGVEAISIAKKEKPNLIILDVMMPQMDGIEACEQMRKLPSLKQSVITFLTARNEDYSQIAGFEAGADDYIAKPIKPKVLVSRVGALLRRFQVDENKSSDRLEFENLIIDRSSYKVTFQNEEIPFPRKEFELLALLASNPGKVYSREKILSKIWGDDVVVVDRTIDVHIRKVREKLDDLYIKTVKGVGYKFEI